MVCQNPFNADSKSFSLTPWPLNSSHTLASGTVIPLSSRYLSAALGLTWSPEAAGLQGTGTLRSLLSPGQVLNTVHSDLVSSDSHGNLSSQWRMDSSSRSTEMTLCFHSGGGLYVSSSLSLFPCLLSSSRAFLSTSCNTCVWHQHSIVLFLSSDVSSLWSREVLWAVVWLHNSRFSLKWNYFRAAVYSSIGSLSLSLVVVEFNRFKKELHVFFKSIFKSALKIE